MSYKKCCVPGCPGTEKVLHQFPNPSKHLDNFMKWLNCTGGEAWNLSNEYIYKNRRVCRIHFETKHLCRNNRLSILAVPTINMPCSKVQRPLPQIHNLPISNFAASKEVLMESVQQRPMQCDVLSQGIKTIAGKVLHEKCSLKDSECLKREVQKSVSDFTAGNPDLGIEPLDKMLLDSVLIKKDGLDFEIKNVKIEGLRNAIIDKILFDTTLKYIHLTFHTNLNIESDYTVAGHLFTFPVSGAGKAHMIKVNDTTELLMLYDLKKDENGKDVINLLDYRYGNDKSGSTYKFENLFNGDKAKSDMVHDFININWRTTALSFGSFLYDKINAKIFNAIKIYLGSFPLEDIAILN